MKNLILAVLDLYVIVIIIRVLFSWIRVNPYNPFVRAVYTVTEPVLGPVRSILPVFGGMDFSPMVVLLIYYAVIKPLIINF